MKVVINKRFGGFGLSSEALRWLADRNSSILTWYTLAAYYGADDNGMVESHDFSGHHVKTKLVPLDEYHAAQMLQCSSRVIEYNGQIVMLDDGGDDPDDSETVRAEQRRHSDLIECVEVLGEKANGDSAELAIVEIPDDVDYIICEYDGWEHIAEKHRTWE